MKNPISCNDHFLAPKSERNLNRKECLLKTELNQVAQNEYNEILEIIYENAHWLDSKGIMQWPINWLNTQQDSIIASVKSGNYFKSEIDHNIAGIVEITTQPDEHWALENTPALYIHKLAIRRKHSKKNLGKAMLGLIENIAFNHGIKHIRLDCISHNSVLRRYYEAYGFKHIKEVHTEEAELSLYQYDIEI